MNKINGKIKIKIADGNVFLNIVKILFLLKIFLLLKTQFKIVTKKIVIKTKIFKIKNTFKKSGNSKLLKSEFDFFIEKNKKFIISFFSITFIRSHNNDKNL
nr:hypothetical protein [Mesomycoplasma neurolyticum]